jgi:deoxyribonuclease V
VVAPTEWPRTAAELTAVQRALAAERPQTWQPSAAEVLVAGCFAAFDRGQSGPGDIGDPIWLGAAVFRRGRCLGHATTVGAAGGAYQPGLLALRVGAALESVVRALPVQPDVLLVDATGRDHPRRCGLAIQLGAVLDLPTVGVTHRTLLAQGEWPADQRGAASPLSLDGEVVGYWLRTRQGRRPLAVHAGWRTDAEAAAGVVLPTCRHRTPRPLREARRLAREARVAASLPR